MARNNLELSVWGDGTIRLSFWDSSEGQDIIFTLVDDGTAWLLLRDTADGEKSEQVDLVRELRKLAQKWQIDAES